MVLPSLNIYTDGGARGNPGPAAIGVVIKDQRQQLIGCFGQTIGVATNNLAEYQAVIAALKWLLDHPHQSAGRRIKFYLDSSLVVNQLNGRWKIKEPHLRLKAMEIRQLEFRLGQPIEYKVIPRRQNTHADALVNQALDKDSC